jgi:hypothetical protein
VYNGSTTNEGPPRRTAPVDTSVYSPSASPSAVAPCSVIARGDVLVDVRGERRVGVTRDGGCDRRVHAALKERGCDRARRSCRRVSGCSASAPAAPAGRRVGTGPRRGAERWRVGSGTSWDREASRDGPPQPSGGCVYSLKMFPEPLRPWRGLRRERSRSLSRDRTRCPRCPASRGTTRRRHLQAVVARVPRRARPVVRIPPQVRPGALHPRARCRPARQDGVDS